MPGASPTLCFPTSSVGGSMKPSNFTVHVCVRYTLLSVVSCYGLSQTLFISISHWHHDSCTYICAYLCTNVAKHIIISIWFTIHYFIPPHADMILTGLFAAIFIWQASLFNVLFHGAEPELVQPEQATSEEGQSELVTGREWHTAVNGGRTWDYSDWNWVKQATCGDVHLVCFKTTEFEVIVIFRDRMHYNVEVHCCIVCRIIDKKELLYRITAWTHSVVQDTMTRRSSWYVWLVTSFRSQFSNYLDHESQAGQSVIIVWLARLSHLYAEANLRGALAITATV